MPTREGDSHPIFNQERHLYGRTNFGEPAVALSEWRRLAA